MNKSFVLFTVALFLNATLLMDVGPLYASGLPSKFLTRNFTWDRSKLPVLLHYNEQGKPSGCPAASTIADFVTTAYSAWSNPTYSYFSFQKASPFTTNAGEEEDDFNVIFWSSSPNPGGLALTLPYPDNPSGPGTNTGVDLLLANDGNQYSWYWYFSYGAPSTRTLSQVDLIENLEHEFGHVVGLADFNQNNSIMRSSYTDRTISFRAIDAGSRAGWIYQTTKDDISLSGPLYETLDISAESGKTVTLNGDVTIQTGYIFKLEYGKCTVNLGTHSIYVAGGEMYDDGGNTWSPVNIALYSGTSLLGHFSSIQSAMSIAQSGQTVVVGAGSYTFSSNLTVPSGVTLQISSGSTLTFAGNCKIRVEGALNAQGVTFTSSNGQWYGIELYGASSNSYIGACTIENATYGIYDYAMWSCRIERCTIQNNTTGIVAISSSNGISQNYITGNQYGVSCTDYSQLDFQSNNWIKNNSTGVYIDGTSTPYLGSYWQPVYCSIWNNNWDVWSDYGGTVSAEWNYWGSYPANPMVYGSVDYSNALTDEPLLYKRAPVQDVRPNSIMGNLGSHVVSDTAGMAELDFARALELKSTSSDARTALVTVITRYPDKPAASIALARLSRLVEKSGLDVTQFLSTYASINTSRPLSDLAKTLTGQIMLRNGDTEGALALFEGLVLVPGSQFEQEALYNAGSLLWYRKDAKVEGEKYFRRLIQKYPDGSFTLSALATLGESQSNKGQAQGSSTQPDVPLVNELSAAFPNPFNPSTQISYSLPEAGRVSLVVYDVLGRQIASLADEYKPAGRYTVIWNSTQNSGIPVSSGVYFARLRITDELSIVKFTKTSKLLLMK